ncbi:GmrSD restriction endonuclease domain-containing protein [Oerskovia paurometabola]|uniref:DUF1524 domain-containing protein n=1 Tax=Oerskovia paurometabola TaxID=162170 RepID=A0ABW1XEB3_9CELL|nr:DUF1524 domain-containing protein [Oerskovia paurometabola]MBM7496834.1 hypothetical protein [Oerskovia paurometabola]
MAKKSAGGAPGVIALIIGVAVAYYAVAWPYLVGTWLAVQMGAGLPSTQRSVLGWVFEVLYLAVLAVVAVRWLTARRSPAGARTRPVPGRLVGIGVAAVAATALVSTGAVAVGIKVAPSAAPALVAEEGAPLDLLDAPETALVEADPEVVAAGDAATADPAELVRFDDAVTTAGAETALAALGTLEVKGRAPKTGYDRDQFGPAWADTDRNGCDTRNDMLARDLVDETFKPGTKDCVVLTGSLADPYTATTIAFQRGNATSSAVQIDHVVALSDAWQKGAQQLDADTRKRFANDPLNLLAVDGPSNQAKGAGDAATWLPPNTAYRCEYVARQVAVKVGYGLWVTQAERDAIARVLSSCPGQLLPTGDSAYAAQGVVEAVVEPAPVVPVPAPAPVVPAPAPAPAPAPVPEPAPADVFYQNCDAVRAAGAAPIYPGDPGFQGKFDRDKDGVGCE